MIQALKRTFALTESGAKGLLKASFYSALMPLAYILPMMIVMLFAQGVLEGGLQPMPFFIASIAIVVLISQRGKIRRQNLPHQLRNRKSLAQGHRAIFTRLGHKQRVASLTAWVWSLGRGRRSKTPCQCQRKDTGQSQGSDPRHPPRETPRRSSHPHATSPIHARADAMDVPPLRAGGHSSKLRLTGG